MFIKYKKIETGTAEIDFLQNGPINEVIEWTKNNLDINSDIKGYYNNLRKNIIKERLDKEKLPYSVVKHNE